jgi:hypothetical protein
MAFYLKSKVISSSILRVLLPLETGFLLPGWTRTSFWGVMECSRLMVKVDNNDYIALD